VIWFIVVWCWVSVCVATKLLCIIPMQAEAWKWKLLIAYTVGCVSAAVFATVMALKEVLH